MIRRMRPLAPATRSWNHRASALPGWCRNRSKPARSRCAALADCPTWLCPGRAWPRRSATGSGRGRDSRPARAGCRSRGRTPHCPARRRRWCRCHASVRAGRRCRPPTLQRHSNLSAKLQGHRGNMIRDDQEPEPGFLRTGLHRQQARPPSVDAPPDAEPNATVGWCRSRCAMASGQGRPASDRRRCLPSNQSGAETFRLCGQARLGPFRPNQPRLAEVEHGRRG